MNYEYTEFFSDMKILGCLFDCKLVDLDTDGESCLNETIQQNVIQVETESPWTINAKNNDPFAWVA